MLADKAKRLCLWGVRDYEYYINAEMVFFDLSLGKRQKIENKNIYYIVEVPEKFVKRNNWNIVYDVNFFVEAKGNYD